MLAKMDISISNSNFELYNRVCFELFGESIVILKDSEIEFWIPVKKKLE